jgi:hypothetical protein
MIVSASDSKSSHHADATSTQPRMLGALHRVWRSAATRWALLATTIASLTAWLLELVPYAPVWGDVATWASAFATGGGLIFAGRTIQLQTRQRQEAAIREDRHQRETRAARARSVGFKTSWIRHVHEHSDGTENECWAIKYAVQNTSPYPITNAVVRAWELMPHDTDDESDPAWKEVDIAVDAGWDYNVSRYLGTLLSGEKIVEEVPVHHPSAGPALTHGKGRQARLHFTDAWDESWDRTDTTIREAEAQPTCLCCSTPVHW